MSILGKQVMIKFIHVSFFLFSFFSMQLFALSIVDESLALRLSETEKNWVAQHPVIKVGVEPNYFNYESVYADGKNISIITEYIYRLEKVIGLHFEIINDKPWPQLLQMAQKGQLDMLTSIVKTPERSKYLTFSESYEDTPVIIIDNSEGTFIGSLKKLSNKRVSIEKDYFMAEVIKNNYPTIEIISAENTKKALEMVLNGVADAYVGDANVADYVIKINHFSTLRFSGQSEYISQQSFAMTKGNEPLAMILTKAMATIPKDETDAIFNRWLNIERGIKKETLVKYGTAIALILMLIGYWVYLLKREISYRKNAEEKLRVSEALFRNLTEDMIDVIWKTDKNYYFTYISPSVEKSLGFLPSELIGHPVFALFTDEGIAASKKIIAQREEELKQGIHKPYSTFEIQHKCKNGDLIWGEILAKPDFDDNFNIISYHGISREITERKEMQDKIRELAFYDPLTQLANRRLLNDRLKQTVSSSKRSKKHSAVIYIDLDNFKPLNDSYGHAIGDLLLVEVANRLTACVREMDTVARVGGDEFALIIHELNDDQEKSEHEANIIAQKILAVLSAAYFLKRSHDNDLLVEHHCTASIGVLVFKADHEHVEILFEQADSAMYQAKEAGRNTIRFYNGSVSNVKNK